MMIKETVFFVIISLF